MDSSRDQWVPTFTANAFPWTDRYAPGGVNSRAAADYCVLNTPNMFLVDKNGSLVSIPETLVESRKAVQ